MYLYYCQHGLKHTVVHHPPEVNYFEVLEKGESPEHSALRV
jgi:hypothetical protein